MPSWKHDLFLRFVEYNCVFYVGYSLEASFSFPCIKRNEKQKNWTARTHCQNEWWKNKMIFSNKLSWKKDSGQTMAKMAGSQRNVHFTSCNASEWVNNWPIVLVHVIISVFLCDRYFTEVISIKGKHNSKVRVVRVGLKY